MGHRRGRACRVGSGLEPFCPSLAWREMELVAPCLRRRLAPLGNQAEGRQAPAAVGVVAAVAAAAVVGAAVAVAAAAAVVVIVAVMVAVAAAVAAAEGEGPLSFPS